MKHALLIAGAVALVTGGAASAQSLQPVHQGPGDVSPSGSRVLAQLVYPPPPPPPAVPVKPPPPPALAPAKPPMPLARAEAPPPPPPRAEVPPPPPPVAPGATAYEWQPGHWSWTGARYVWVEGRYSEKPQVTARWVPWHWQRHRNGSWAWLDGHWAYGAEGEGEGR